MEFMALVGGQVSLPCNITSPSREDIAALILWYRGDSRNPIYTVDGRYLVTCNLSHDFASLPVPAKNLLIFDDTGNEIKGIGGPFNEDMLLNLTCESVGGNPFPAVSWWKDAKLIDNSYFTSPKGSVVNVLSLPPLKRKDLMMELTCQASNNNLTAPATVTISIDINLKPREVKIITQLPNMLANERYEFVCQSSGSRPPAKLAWFKDGVQLPSVGESTSDDGSVTTNFLTLVPSLDDNNKQLLCSAQNPRFPTATMEDSFVLKVHFGPILSLALGASIQHQEILEGSDVFFECNIQANPPVTKIGWLFNGEPLKSDLNSRIHISNGSLLIQSVGRIHRGSYQCWAVNSVEKGESEIVDLNVKSPDSPENCTITNITAHTLTVECLPGYSGGLDQTFHLEVYINSNSNKRLINNLTSSEYPFFIANALPAGNSFYLVTYASNSRGRSPSVRIKGNTLVAERWQTDYFEETVISTSIYVLMGIVGALVLLAIIIILIMKIKSEEDTRRVTEKASSDVCSTPTKKKVCVQNCNNTLFCEEYDDNCGPDVIPPEIIIENAANVDEDGKSEFYRVNNIIPVSIIVPPPSCFHDGYDDEPRSPSKTMNAYSSHQCVSRSSENICKLSQSADANVEWNCGTTTRPCFEKRNYNKQNTTKTCIV
ncbi:hemicentin-2-like protein, partial [Dinothrombium tinctorium]